MSQMGSGPLQNGGRVVVIGGGPGGTAAAITLKRKAETLGREIQVTIVEGKHFSGEQHYNQCAGVLSPPITELIERDLNIPFPYALSKGKIYGYVLHACNRDITLDGEDEPSIALRRIQFDNYMLQTAQEKGINLIPARATGIEFHSERVVIYTESQPLEADVVVGAFGMDEGTAMLFYRTVGYQRPQAINSIVTKIHPGEEAMLQFGSRIHAFLPSTKQIEFGAISPKGDHLTINVAGTSVNSDFMDKFLAMPVVRQALPSCEPVNQLTFKGLHYYKGSFPSGPGKNIIGDRFVMVGDAAGLVRAFKGKGVTTAIQSGIRAAETILFEGISGKALQTYLASNRDILKDLPYGQIMRQLTILASRYGLMAAVIEAAQKQDSLRQALFGAVSGHWPYQKVLKTSFSPSNIWAIGTTAISPRPRAGRITSTFDSQQKKKGI